MGRLAAEGLRALNPDDRIIVFPISDHGGVRLQVGHAAHGQGLNRGVLGVE